MLVLNTHRWYVVNLAGAMLHVSVVVHVHVSDFVQKLFHVDALV